MKSYVHILLPLLLLWNSCDSAKILAIFPTASYSHQQPLLAVSKALAAKGHDLIVITANPIQPPIKNHRDIDVGFQYKIMEQIAQKSGFSMQQRSGAFSLAKSFPSMVKLMLSVQFESQSLQDLIREVNGTKFDLIIYESMFYSSYLGFSELVGNPPVVGLLTFHPCLINESPGGNPIISSYMPSSASHLGDTMTFTERTINFIINLCLYVIRVWYLDPMQEDFMKKNFGDVKHTAYELERNVSMVIITADLASSYPRPVHPNTVYVGPTHMVPPQPLPQDIQKWMDGAEDGVIYFSLGSNMQGTSVPEAKRSAFIRAFSQFPRVRVLWKWESDDKLPGQPDNVLVKKWLPQQSVIAHPKTRLFISQVGLQSMQEATSYGVPILGIPMFADQNFNAKKVEQSGAGITMDFDDITYETVYDNLKKLLLTNSYRESMQRLSSVTKDKPMPAVESAVWWIEYVLRHQGAPHLRPASQDLRWDQYYCIDVVCVLVTVPLMCLYLIYFVLRKTIRNVTSRDKEKTH